MTPAPMTALGRTVSEADHRLSALTSEVRRKRLHDPAMRWLPSRGRVGVMRVGVSVRLEFRGQRSFVITPLARPCPEGRDSFREVIHRTGEMLVPVAPGRSVAALGRELP
jgi:hypothetical protein